LTNATIAVSNSLTDQNMINGIYRSETQEFTERLKVVQNSAANT
jgi:hypothetical protein